MGEIFVLVREPGTSPRRVPIVEGGVIVGRLTTANGVVLGGNGVQPEHCKLDRKGDTVTVTNLAKTGTLRNGQPLAAPATLTVGDTLRVGDTEIVFLGVYASTSTQATSTAGGHAKGPQAPTLAAPHGDDSWIPGPPPKKETDEQRVARLPTEIASFAAETVANVKLPTEAPAAGNGHAPAPKQKSNRSSGIDSARSRKNPSESDALRKKTSGKSSSGELSGVPKDVQNYLHKDVKPPEDSGMEEVGAQPAHKPAPPAEKDPQEEEQEHSHKKRRSRSERGGKNSSTTLAVIGGVLLIAVVAIIAVKNQHPPEHETHDDTASNTEHVDKPKVDSTRAQATEAWEKIVRLPVADVPVALDDFAKRYSSDSRATDAVWIAKRMRESGTADAQKGVATIAQTLLDEGDKLQADRQLSRAKMLFELVAQVTSTSPTVQELAQSRLDTMVTSARAQYDSLVKDAKDALDSSNAMKALAVVIEGRERLRGLGLDEDVEKLSHDYEEMAFKSAEETTKSTKSKRGGSSGANTRGPIDLTMKLDFEAAKTGWASLLLSPLTVEERLRVEWSHNWCTLIEAMFNDVIKAANAGRRPTITVRGLKGVITKADQKNVWIQAGLEGGSVSFDWKWEQIDAGQALEMFEQVAGQDELKNFALAFCAFTTAHDDKAHGYLVDCLTRAHDALPRISSFLAIQNETVIPEGGYVVFEGRFTTTTERDAVLAARKKAKEEAAEAKKALAQAKEKVKFKKYLDQGFAMIEDGFYMDGRGLLEAIIKRVPEQKEIVDAAKARLNAPYLRRRILSRKGPSKNRLDIYIMADGFILDDDQQKKFDHLSEQCMKIHQLQDLWREYDNYVNYWELNIASKEQGITTDGKKKDTALGGEINGGVFTEDGGKVLGLLREAFPDESDNCAFGIGNADASVATGGGGVAALPRSFLGAAPHEFGHAFGGLLDEYESGGEVKKTGPGERPEAKVAATQVGVNIVNGSDEAEVRKIAAWQHWIKISDDKDKNYTGKPIDVFEGANHSKYNMWRPMKQCCMRDVGSPFCVVCMERMLTNLYHYVKIIDQVDPPESTIKHPHGKDLILKLKVMKPRTHDIETTWKMEWNTQAPAPTPTPTPAPEGTPAPDGSTVSKDKQERQGPPPQPKGWKPPKFELKRAEECEENNGAILEGIKIRGSDLKPDMSVVITVKCKDPTPWILKDDEKLLQQEWKWTIDVQ